MPGLVIAYLCGLPVALTLSVLAVRKLMGEDLKDEMDYLVAGYIVIGMTGLYPVWPGIAAFIGLMLGLGRIVRGRKK